MEREISLLESDTIITSNFNNNQVEKFALKLLNELILRSNQSFNQNLQQESFASLMILKSQFLFLSLKMLGNHWT